MEGCVREEGCAKDRDAFPRHAPRNKAVRHGMVEPDLEAYRGSSVFVRARPGYSGGLSVPLRYCVSCRDSVAYGAVVWARRATNRPFRRFPGSRTTRARRSCRAAPSASGTSGEGQRRIDEGALPFATAMPSPDSDHPYKREREREDERLLSPAAGTATSCTRATSSSTASGGGKSAPTRPTPTAKFKSRPGWCCVLTHVRN